MKSILSAILFFVTLFANGQDLYSRSFGKSTDKPVIFLHGGPGYNSANFEATTAQQLADKGFYVIVYDRRGEGRSIDPNATFTFKEVFDDLNNIYKKYGISGATLIGHSFGGVVATLYAGSFPGAIQSVMLVGAPVSLQTTFKHIIARSKDIYQLKKDSVNLAYLSTLETMDSTGIEYSSYCFRHAMQNGFYTTKNPSAEAKAIYSKFRTDSLLIKYASKMTYPPVLGFWKQEKYTTIDLAGNIIGLGKKQVKVYGLYGKEDGLYSIQQVTDLQNMIGPKNLRYFDNCSHNVFIDQQVLFIDAIQKWTE